MKKSIYLLGMAVAALSSCSQSDVVEMPESAAIKFNSFVNNNTRDVTEVVKDGLTQFYVIGYMCSTGTNSYTTPVYKNELQTTPYYWQANHDYLFAAYADGNNGEIENAKFEPSTLSLSFEDYTPNDAKDLVATIGANSVGKDLPTTPMPLTFKHMLAQVGLTFKNTDGVAYTLKISDIKINNAIKTGKGYYNNGNINWEGQREQAAYSYEEIADLAENTKEHKQYKLVIPQAGTDQINVTFTATISGAGMAEKSSTFQATLGYDPEATGKGTANTWTPGYRYNYTATINADQIDPSLQNQKIEFTATVEEDWKDANDTDKGELEGTPVTKP